MSKIKDIEIIDNFLDQKNFDIIKKTIVNNEYFPWNYFNYRVRPGDEKSQFVHYVYENNSPVSSYMNNILPLINKLRMAAIRRVKINMTLPYKEMGDGDFHVDFSHNTDNCKTGIFYLTTTDGPTIFEDNIKVDCVENRMVIFPTNKKHKGTINTNKEARVLINLNWF